MAYVSKREYRLGTLGWWMDDRRGDLQMTWEEVAERAGTTPETLRRNADDPSRMRTTTRKGIERALRWERGSIDDILAGGEPTPIAREPEQPIDYEQLAAERAAAQDGIRRAQEALARFDAILNERRRSG